MAGGASALRLTRGRAVVALAGLLVLAFLALPPYSFTGKANLIGYGICHQRPERSYFVGGRQLPLCARDTGTYLGAMATLAVLLAGKGRRRTGLPTTPVLVVLALGFVFFAVDGVNSYATILPYLPHLYTPDNRLRLLSGLFCGAGIVGIVLPLFNYSVWRDWEQGTVLDGRRFAIVLAAMALCFIAVVRAPGWLYYPLALINVAGVVFVLSAVNGLLAYLLLGRERQGHRWLDVVPILATGLLMAAIELGGLGYLRYMLESAAGL